MEGTGERAIPWVAARQRGLVHRSQLRAAGIGRKATARLVRRGALHPVLPRVHAVGHPGLAPLARELAVALYVGRDFALSHRTAATLWGIAPGPADGVDVTLIGRDAVPRHGLVTRRVPQLDARDVRLVQGLPATAPARTLIDLAAVTTSNGLERALNEARVLRLVTDGEIWAALERCPFRTGVARIRALLDADAGPGVTRSTAERELRRLVENAHLPPPRYNARLYGFEVDALWSDPGLVVEVDGYAVHGRRRSFEGDRRRDQVLVASGYVVVRVTWRQLTEEPLAVLARLAQALAVGRRRPDAA